MAATRTGLPHTHTNTHTLLNLTLNLATRDQVTTAQGTD